MSRFNLRKMTLCALFAALTGVCAWISVPFADTAFTMQTFAVFLALFTLGGKLGGLTILVYLCLGAAGLPVFSGFRGGVQMLLGPTGGYLWGFLLTAAVYELLTLFFPGMKKWLAAGISLTACYASGCLWYHFAFGVTIPAALTLTVAPYILPDGLKLALAWRIYRRISKGITGPSRE